MKLTIFLGERERRAITWARTPGDQRPSVHDIEPADEQECLEHLLGFIELAIEESGADA
jgi:hypothetical protein